MEIYFKSRFLDSVPVYYYKEWKPSDYYDYYEGTFSRVNRVIYKMRLKKNLESLPSVYFGAGLFAICPDADYHCFELTIFEEKSYEFIAWGDDYNLRALSRKQVIDLENGYFTYCPEIISYITAKANYVGRAPDAENFAAEPVIFYRTLEQYIANHVEEFL